MNVLKKVFFILLGISFLIRPNISGLLSQFKHKKILVVGDIMLDRARKGTVSRISPEAPVPIVRISEESCNPGGAGNLAVNLGVLGANVCLVGIIGKDYEGELLVEELNNVTVDQVITCARDTFKDGHVSLATLGPIKEQELDLEESMFVSAIR